MKKRLLFVLSLLLTVSLFAGCSKSASDSSAYYAKNNSGGSAPTSAAAESSYVNYDTMSKDYAPNDYGVSQSASAANSSGTGTNEVKPEQNAGRKLIKRVNLSIESLEFDASVSAIEATVAGLGGYIESSSINNSGYYDYYSSRGYSSRNRVATYVLRIPGDKLDAFMNNLGSFGNVISQNSSSEDITLSYIDIEARTESLEIQQERLLALLEKAETVEEIISLEDRLSTVRYQIESLKSQLKNYDNLVSYSTVSITLSEVVRITQPEPETVGERITSGLSETFYDLGIWFTDFAVGFVVNLPYIIIWAIVIVIAIIIIRALVKKSRKNKAKRAAEAQAAWVARQTAQGYPVNNTVQPQAPAPVQTQAPDNRTK